MIAALAAGELLGPLVGALGVVIILGVASYWGLVVHRQVEAEKQAIIDTAEKHDEIQVTRERAMEKALEALTFALEVIERERDRLLKELSAERRENQRLHERLDA